MGFVRYGLATLLGRPTIKVSINGFPILIRPRSPELRVATVSPTREFEPMAGYFPLDFDRLIVDAGAYIGTAVRKLAAMVPVRSSCVSRPLAQTSPC